MDFSQRLTKEYLETVFPDIPDGSETILQAGTNVSIIGNGTLTTPYIISANNNLLYDYDSVARLNTNILNSTLLPQPILSLSTAIRYHKNNPEATGIALTKEFALLKSPFLLEHENYLLVRKNNPCAIVYPATQTIEIKFEYLKQEILDLLKNEPYKWIIKP